MTKKGFSAGIIIAVLIAWIASFAMWFAISSSSGYLDGNAWDSTFSILGVKIPNWFLVITATVIGIFKILEQKNYLDAGKWPFFLSLYGLFQASFATLVALDPRAEIGVGLILTLIVFIYFLIVCRKSSAPATKEN